jgi:hypothetical protein
MYVDPEITAMSEVLEALSKLDNSQRQRILEWITGKFGLFDPDLQSVQEPQQHVQEPAPIQTTPTPDVEEDVEDVEEDVEDVEDVEHEQKVEKIEKVEKVEKDEAGEIEDETNDSHRRPGVKRFKSIESLFLSADVKTVASKILLAAAYLQEKMNMEELTSFDINSRLKKLGYGVPNISSGILSLLKKKSPLMIQTGKDGDSKQSKCKFIVTKEGLKLAGTFIKAKGNIED